MGTAAFTRRNNTDREGRGRMALVVIVVKVGHSSAAWAGGAGQYWKSHRS